MKNTWVHHILSMANFGKSGVSKIWLDRSWYNFLISKSLGMTFVKISFHGLSKSPSSKNVTIPHNKDYTWLYMIISYNKFIVGALVYDIFGNKKVISVISTLPAKSNKRKSPPTGVPKDITNVNFTSSFISEVIKLQHFEFDLSGEHISYSCTIDYHQVEKTYISTSSALSVCPEPVFIIR